MYRAKGVEPALNLLEGASALLLLALQHVDLALQLHHARTKPLHLIHAVAHVHWWRLRRRLLQRLCVYRAEGVEPALNLLEGVGALLLLALQHVDLALQLCHARRKPLHLIHAVAHVHCWRLLSHVACNLRWRPIIASHDQRGDRGVALRLDLCHLFL